MYKYIIPKPAWLAPLPDNGKPNPKLQAAEDAAHNFMRKRDCFIENEILKPYSTNCSIRAVPASQVTNPKVIAKIKQAHIFIVIRVGGSTSIYCPGAMVEAFEANRLADSGAQQMMFYVDVATKMTVSELLDAIQAVKGELVKGKDTVRNDALN